MKNGTICVLCANNIGGCDVFNPGANCGNSGTVGKEASGDYSGCRETICDLKQLRRLEGSIFRDERKNRQDI